MEKDPFLQELEEIVDIGDPTQIQLYADILSDQNIEGKLSKTAQLLNQIISKIKNGTTNLETLGLNSFQTTKTQPSSQSEEISRLLAHLQHFVSILESFSINSEYLNLFIENKETSSKLIPRTFFEAEAARLKSFLDTFSDREFIDSFLSKIQPEFLTQKLAELRVIQSKVENSTSVPELRNHFQEICTLFELASLLNDRLIVRVRGMAEGKGGTGGCDGVLAGQVESLKAKLSESSSEKEELGDKMRKIESEVAKLRQLCRDYSSKADELFEKNKKLKLDLGFERQRQQQLKKEAAKMKKQLDRQNEDRRVRDDAEAAKDAALAKKDEQIDAMTREIQKVKSLTSQLQSVSERYEKAREDAKSGQGRIESLTKENEKLKNELKIIQSLKGEYERSVDDLNSSRVKAAALAKENERLKSEVKKAQKASSHLHTLQSDCERFKSEAAEISEKASTLSNENERLKSDLHDALSRMKKSENDAALLANENAKLKEAAASNESLREENDRLRSELTSLKDGDTQSSESSSLSKLASARRKNRRLKELGRQAIEENDQLKAALERAAGEVSAANARLTAECSKSADLSSQIVILTQRSGSEVEALKAQLEKVTQEKAAMATKTRDDSARLSKQNEFLMQNLAAFKEKFNTLKQETNSELQSLHSQIENLRRQKKQLKTAVNRLRKNAPSDSQISETISSLEMEKNELRKENEELTNELNSLRMENQQLGRISDEIATKYEQKIESIKSLNDEIERLSKVKDQIESQISSHHSLNDNTIVNIDNNSCTNAKTVVSNSFTNLNDSPIIVPQNNGESIDHQNKMEASKFAVMLAGALSEPIKMNQVKNEIFRLIDIVRNEHAAVSASQNSSLSQSQAKDGKSGDDAALNSDGSTQPFISSVVPVLIPQFDDLDREIVNLQRSIKPK